MVKSCVFRRVVGEGGGGGGYEAFKEVLSTHRLACEQFTLFRRENELRESSSLKKSVSI